MAVFLLPQKFVNMGGRGPFCVRPCLVCAFGRVPKEGLMWGKIKGGYFLGGAMRERGKKWNPWGGKYT